MLNRDKKKIKIVDYKTGRHNEEQIKVYEKIVQNIYPILILSL